MQPQASSRLTAQPLAGVAQIVDLIVLEIGKVAQAPVVAVPLPPYLPRDASEPREPAQELPYPPNDGMRLSLMRRRPREAISHE